MKSIENGDIRWYAFYKEQDLTPVSQGYGGKSPLMNELKNKLYPTNSSLVLDELYEGSHIIMREKWEYLSPAESVTKNSWNYETLVANEFKWMRDFNFGKEIKKEYLHDFSTSDADQIRKEIKEMGLDKYGSVRFIDYPIELNRKVNNFVSKWGYYPSLCYDMMDPIKDFINNNVEYRRYTIKISRDQLVK